MNIETWFGTFYKGEGVEVSETGLLGETRIVRGFVRERDIQEELNTWS